MLVTGQYVDTLVPVALCFEQIGIDASSGLRAPGRLVHAGRRVVAIRQRFVHAGDDSPDRPIGGVAGQRAFEPRDLGVVELVVRGIVEKVEGDAAIDPVVVARDARIGRCVFPPLRAQHGGVEPRGERRTYSSRVLDSTTSWLPMPMKYGIEPKGAIWLVMKSRHSIAR
jgi:hypothetical protein